MLMTVKCVWTLFVSRLQSSEVEQKNYCNTFETWERYIYQNKVPLIAKKLENQWERIPLYESVGYYSCSS